MNDMNALLPYVTFRFNLEHPSYEECYLFGYECAISEVEESENPYLPGSEQYEQWAEGWWAGFYGEKPLFSGDSLTKEDLPVEAANDQIYHWYDHLKGRVFKYSGALAAAAVVGYQIIDLVA